MASKDQPKAPQGAPSVSSPDNPTPPNIEDVLRPFQEASDRFLQAHLAAQESAIRQRVQAWLDYQDEVRNVEQETYRAVMAATRKQLDQFGQQATGNVEQVYSTRARSQFEYDNEVRRVYAEAQAKLADLTRQAGGESGGGGGEAQKLAGQRQDSYQTYLSDLQQAWSSTKALDPQTINVIASHILSTMNAVSQTGW
jgi:hypothetical protein